MSETADSDIPFLAHCGIRMIDSRPGWTRLEVEVAPHLCNRKGHGHGGLVATLLDNAMGAAARLATQAPNGLVTVDLHTTFIGPAIGRVHCEGRVLHRRGSIVFCEATVTSGDGSLAARGLATFRLRRPEGSPPADG